MSEAAVISRRSPPESIPESLGRVLVIDDEAEIRESLETLLQLEGFAVSSAATGRDGLTLLGERTFDIVLFDLVSQVAPSRSTILLQGESGTGKELIAKAIHLHSARRDRSFVPVNTGSMPADLLESNLFGHVKGAFTSAIASKKGLFEVADRGTLFLDEIGTMSLDTQSKILRVL